jgi:hypothetical protein
MSTGINRLGANNGRWKGGVYTLPGYNSYHSAKQRCTNPKSKQWKDYGGRGIEFRFTDIAQLFAEIGSRPKGMSIDRIDNDGHYESGNVRWATRKQQRENSRPSPLPSEEARKNMSSSLVGNTNCLEKRWTLTTEQRQHRSAALKGKLKTGAALAACIANAKKATAAVKGKKRDGLRGKILG